VLAWLKRLRSARPAVGGASAAVRSREAPAAPPRIEATSGAAAAPAGSPAPGPAGDPRAWAEALGVDVDALEPMEEDLPEDEEQLARAVLAHFDAHRPGPASFPAISLQVYEVAQDPDVEIARLASLIELDAALTAGVLVLANSPIFRGVDRIETARQAIARLGTGEVARLATALSTRSLFRPEVRAEFKAFAPTWNALFYHSAVVARTATSLGTIRRIPGTSNAFVGGMLHDVGKSIALRSLAALAADRQVTVPGAAAISRVLHRVHVEVGAEVHREWRLPAHLTLLAVRHHEPSLPADGDLGALHLVRLASALSLLGSEPTLHLGAPLEAIDSARALGLAPDRVAALRVEVAEQGEWVRMLFGDEAGGPSQAR